MICSGFCELEGFGEGDGDAPAAFAFFGGGHAGEDFDHFRRRDRRLAGAEEIDDGAEERLIVVIVVDVGDSLRSEDGDAEAGFAGVFADGAVSADPPVFPDGGDLFRERGLEGGDRFASGTHQGEEEIDSVDAVPEEIGMTGGRPRLAVGVAAQDFADLGIVFQLGIAGGESAGGSGEPGSAVLLFEFGDGEDIL